MNNEQLPGMPPMPPEEPTIEYQVVLTFTTQTKLSAASVWDLLSNPANVRVCPMNNMKVLRVVALTQGQES